MRRRGVLPCDRARYLATVAALVAVYGAIVVLDWLLWITGREPIVNGDGQYPLEVE